MSIKEMAYGVYDTSITAHGLVISHNDAEERERLFQTPLAAGIREVGETAYALSEGKDLSPEQLTIISNAAKGYVQVNGGNVTLPRNLVKASAGLALEFPGMFNLSAQECDDIRSAVGKRDYPQTQIAAFPSNE